MVTGPAMGELTGPRGEVNWLFSCFSLFSLCLLSLRLDFPSSLSSPLLCSSYQSPLPSADPEFSAPLSSRGDWTIESLLHMCTWNYLNSNVKSEALTNVCLPVGEISKIMYSLYRASSGTVLQWQHHCTVNVPPWVWQAWDLLVRIHLN